MKNKKFFLLILFLVIGFASISATLVINGNTKVAANLDDFNVIFIEAFLDGEESPNVEIDSTKKTLTFTTNKLTNINDTARVDYKVKNISTQYNGDVTINCTNEANEYVNVTSSFDGMTLPLTSSINMQAQEVKNGYINAELTKAVTEDQEVKITCKIEVSATSRTNYAYSLIFDSDGGSKIDDKSINLNESYGELSIPEKEGYTFIGWFDENDVRVDENTIIDTKGNRKLYARWSEVAYSVTLKKVYSDRVETSTINIPYGDSINESIKIDDKYFIDNIECTSGYTIENYNKEDLVYGEQTIRINNNHIAKDSICTITITQGVFDYSYIGSEQEFIVPLDGNYKIELWGSSGEHNGLNESYGRGAYTKGNIYLNKKEKFYVYVGNNGNNESINHDDVVLSASYNGGGGGESNGGGATDIRLVGGTWNNFASLKSRIIVAAGGGGSAYLNTTFRQRGDAGGISGIDAIFLYNSSTNYSGHGATQTSGGKPGRSFEGMYEPIELPTMTGKYGIGGYSFFESSRFIASGGGGGYYGGGHGNHPGSSWGGGGGGSSFISGHAGCDAVAENSTQTNIIHTGQPNHYSGLVFTNTIMVDGAGYTWTNVKGGYTGMPTYDGRDIMPGNNNTGYAKITYLG